ncbi:YhcN/YlaJ family sporulation lipoprotein [Cytobacillus praedii]|uniref:YhcN/YlaJ family sporulation lipoprotein n=1 Tax=Cytobacillus praedii TaxID=1742358 RepID=UPI002E1B7966|nr:YhcN/YlaJ family sporulation lipoprotein [Cytobacillus praedii]
MEKKLIVLPFTLIMSLGLAGCGTNDESAGQQRYKDGAQPIGYYSNENHRNKGGNAQLLDGADNDGALTEMMDHTLGEEGKYERNNLQNRNANVPTPQRVSDNGEPYLFKRDDANFHGHLGFNKRASNSYYEAYNGEMVERINQAAAAVDNVNDVQSVVNGNYVIIAADINDTAQKKATIAKINQAVQPYLNGKTSKVVTDESTFNRLKVIDNDLRDGGPRDQLYLDVKNLFRNMTE